MKRFGLFLLLVYLLGVESSTKMASASVLLAPTVNLFSENFDSITHPAFPTGWDTFAVVGTKRWTTETSGSNPLTAPRSTPNLAQFDSFDASSGTATRLFRTSGLSLSGYASPNLHFWMYHDPGYPVTPGNGDRIQVQVTTDGGTTWNDVGTAISRYRSGTAAWAEEIVDLSTYAGQTDVRIAFLGISAFGNSIFIDDVSVVAGTPVKATIYIPLIFR